LRAAGLGKECFIPGGRVAVTRCCFEALPGQRPRSGLPGLFAARAKAPTAVFGSRKCFRRAHDHQRPC
jgi:hypothetical protein